MDCPYCDIRLHNIDKYLFHLKYIHKKDNYTCHFQNCLRAFHRKDSFKKHLLTHEFDTSLKKLIHNSTVDTIHSSDTNPDKKMFLQTESSSSDINNILSPLQIDGSHDKETMILKDNISSFLEKLYIALRHFVVKLYDNFSLTKSDIQKIMDMFQTFCCSVLLNGLKQIISNCDLDKIVSSFEVIASYFNEFDTEYKRELFFQNSKYYITPLQNIIGTCTEESRRKNSVSLTIKNRTCCYVPIEKQLQQFLKLPNVFQQILDYQKELELNNSNFYKNMVQGSLWNSIKLDATSNKIILPLILYFDDFETGNPLGSHAGYYKIGCLYYSIPTIPPKYNSRLENIFISTLFHCSDRCHYGNNSILKHVINELQLLEKDGIYVENEDKRVYFALSFVIGDNLEVHSMLGLNESFSSNYYCRFCLVDKNLTKELITEQSNLLRLRDQYVHHLENKRFGIKEIYIQ